MQEEQGHNAEHHMLDIIIDGFTSDRESKSSKNKYVRQVMHVAHAPLTKSRALVITVSFSHIDFEDIIPHENDSIMINLQIHNWNMKRVLIDLDISTNIFYWEAFQGFKYGLELL